jgi:hypothetical protein
MADLISMLAAAAGTSAGGGEYQISRSLRFNSADSAYLSRTPASAGDRKTWTWSGWVKRGIFTGSGQSLFGAYTDSNNRMFLHFNSANPLFIFGITGGVVDISVSTSGVFRDVSAWYHVVFVLDTTQATAANRAKIYVNGVQQSLSFSTAPGPNADLYLNTAQPHKIGDLDGTVFYDGYMTEINFIDGQALTPSSFGETNATTGVWSPIAYAGSYGTNGFYLNFSDNSDVTATTLGKDQAGSNNWTPNNFSVTAGAGNDSLVDTPTPYGTDTGAGGEVRGNYCTWNVLDIPSNSNLANGNLDFTNTFIGGYWRSIKGTIPVSSAFTGLSGSFYPAFSDGDPSNALTVTANFGQRPFAYTAPSGFKALVTTNLPEPTVVQGDDYFNTVLYTGNGGTTNVTGVGFQPDWVWYKCRSDAFSNRVFDVVRGVSKGLITNSTAVEEDPLNGVTSFDADGFTVGSDSGGNFNGSTFVAWNWKANGAGVSNTAGSITSTVSANTIAGISIVTYTGNATQGATVGHGLGVTPSMLIVKSRSLATDWVVQHSSAGTAPSKLILNSTAAVTNSAPEWNNAGGTPTAFNSTVFTIAGSGYSVNNSGATYVAYCFAEVEGFSKFGSFTGNGSADGPFVYTGFRPAFFLYKKSSSTSDWWMFDAARNTYNVVSAYLFPNLSNAEGTENWFDFTANGLKMRDRTDLNTNHSGSTYIYMAFAENPFKYSLAR